MDKWQMLLLAAWAIEMAYLAGLAIRLTRWAFAQPERHEPITGTLEFEDEPPAGWSARTSVAGRRLSDTRQSVTISKES